MTAGTDDLVLETRGLTKSFRGFAAVDGVDLQVGHGRVHALVGPNGAGKTTMFNLLTGFLKPTSGRVLFNGRDITGMEPEAITPLGVARSFQITSLFDEMSLIEHVELALASRSGLTTKFWRSQKILRRFHEEAMVALDRVGLKALSHARAGSLAYGQKRALELTLAVALDPQLLLLDEPTAGMGLEDVDRTIALIKELSAGRTVVFVDHNMHVVGSLADEVTVMQSGRVLVQGTYDEVRADSRVVEAYLGSSHATD